MRRMIGGRMIDIPENADGTTDVRDLFRAGGVGSRETLIEQSPTGENYIVPRHGKHRAHPNSAFTVAPLIERGTREADAVRFP